MVAFAAASAAAVGAFMAIQGAANRADQQIKASSSYGIPIEQLGRLSHAAELSGASMEEVGKAAQRTARAVNYAMTGVTNESTRAFEQMGVALTNTDGTAREVEGILGDVAERFAAMPDGAQKTALAVEMFGRSGAKLIPMLNAGREGLRDMGDEAERLGLVFSENTARSSERFNDNILRLSRSMTGLWNQVLANVIEGFAQLTDKIVEATQQGGLFDGVINVISGSFNALVRSLMWAIDNIDTLINIAKVWISLQLAAITVDAGRAFFAFARAVQTAGFASAALSTITKGKIIVLGTLAAVLAAAAGKLDDFTNFVDEAAQSLMSVIPEDWTQGIQDGVGTLNNLWFRGFDETETALDNVNTTLPEIATNSGGAATALGGVSEAAGEAGTALETMAQLGKQVTSTLASGFTDLFTGMIDGTKSATQAIGDLLSSLGKLLINNAFNSLFSGLFGSGGGLGGIFGGGGVPSFAGGGFTGLGARSGGLDGNGGFAALLHPNETVIDHTKGQGMGGMVFNIDARGAQQGVGSEIARELRKQLPDAIQSYNKNPYRR
ncbi:hypothetical protein [Pelagibacterium sp.]|uniref:hypothetical protein n=1 Tax=Pelagibacterium sp. TaxID=1967288 RepID=UPI003A8D17DD